MKVDRAEPAGDGRSARGQHVKLTNNTGVVSKVVSGLEGVATLALHQASAWAVEGQGDHYWDPASAGPNANPPFRLMEIPLAVGAGEGIASITTPEFFPEGVTVDDDGNFYIGSMELGVIYRAGGSGDDDPDRSSRRTSDLVSVLGLYADNAGNRLWVCSSDAERPGARRTGPVALKAFNLDNGAPPGQLGVACASGAVDADHRTPR